MTDETISERETLSGSDCAAAVATSNKRTTAIIAGCALGAGLGGYFGAELVRDAINTCQITPYNDAWTGKNFLMLDKQGGGLDYFILQKDGTYLPFKLVEGELRDSAGKEIGQRFEQYRKNLEGVVSPKD